MKPNVGIWIDHRQAVVVTIIGDQEAIRVIESNVERHARISGGTRSANPTSPQEVVSESQRDERYRHHLAAFYDEVQKSLGAPEKIAIFGPGEAKLEFVRHLQKTKKLQSRISCVDPADKMTPNQLVAKVRQYFQTA